MSHRVVLTGGQPWGLRLCGGKEEGEPFFMISKVNQGSLADIHGISEGDYVLGINGTALEGLLLSQAVNLIRAVQPGSSLALEIRPARLNLISLSAMNGESRIVNSIVVTPPQTKDSTRYMLNHNSATLPWLRSGATTKVYKPVAFSATSPHNSKQAATDSKRISSEIQHSVSMSASEDVVKKGIKATEIAATNQGTGSSGQKSKGVNLFLQRQKLIADMMEQEEEDARAAEEAKIQEAENKRIQEELRRKQEAERLKLEEEKRRQEEKLLESEKKKAARAAKFKSINPDPEPVARTQTSVRISTSSHFIETSSSPEDNQLRISESPPNYSSTSHTPTENGNTEHRHSHLPGLDHNDNRLEGEDFPDLSLPKSQLPTVTLLQKSRDYPYSSASTSDMQKIRACLAGPTLYDHTQAGEIPHGALYVGTNERIEGGFRHTDQFYLVPVNHQTDSEENTTSSPHSEVNKPQVPAQDQPVASGSKDRQPSSDNSATTHESQTKNANKSKDANKSKEWYTEMYKKIHKGSSEQSDENPYQPTYVFPTTVDSEPLDEIDLSTQTTYRPTYNFPEEGNSANTAAESLPVVKQRPRMYEPTTPNELPSPAPRVNGNMVVNSTADQVVSPARGNGAQINSRPALHHSTTETITTPTSTSLSIDTSVGNDNPFTSRASSSSTRSSRPSSSVQSEPSPLSPSLQYKEIQKGGDIPLSGLRKPAPVTPPPRVEPQRSRQKSRNKQRNGETTLNTRQSSANTPQARLEPPPYSPVDTDISRGRQTYRTEYSNDRLARSLSRNRSSSSKHTSRRSVTPSRTLHVIQRNPNSPQKEARNRPQSLHLELTSEYQNLAARRSVSPAGSLASSSSTTSRASSRRSLVIVAPSNVLNGERSTIQEGTIQKKCRSVSATQELNVQAPSPLKVKLTEVPKSIPKPVAGYDRAPAPIPRDQRDRVDAQRREKLSKLEQDEKRKKAREEEADRRARRHSDCFTMKEKSPIPHNRYEQSFFSSSSSMPPHSPARSVTSQQSSPRSTAASEPPMRQTARALYSFNAQHPRELPVKKGDFINIVRRVDTNWYEATKDGRVGIVPVTYIQVIRDMSMSPPPVRPAPPKLREGSAVSKHNFNPQSATELPLKKGDQVSLIRRIDNNWYEGRLQNSSRTGIFPVSYVQVISDPEMPTAPMSPRRSPMVNRSQSAPDGNPASRSPSVPSPHHPINGVSPPSQLLSPLGRTPSSGYGSTDQLLSNDIRHNNNNNNYDKAKINQRHNGHITEEPDPNTPILRPYSGLEMPSYRSLYNYSPRNEDELELHEGDVVHVIEKCADGWFVGTSGRTGMFGTFPGNYVTPI